LVQQKALTVEKLVNILTTLTRESCLKMADKARALGKPDATVVVARVCMEVAL
jgi:UDP-N-acetylglucosamine--N-acetylmuramyl-(pentapeptide) pyrophosphoryl-undecaprenol N-acetylglucosamine transferase